MTSSRSMLIEQPHKTICMLYMITTKKAIGHHSLYVYLHSNILHKTFSNLNKIWPQAIRFLLVFSIILQLTSKIKLTNFFLKKILKQYWIICTMMVVVVMVILISNIYLCTFYMLDVSLCIYKNIISYRPPINH